MSPQFAWGGFVNVWHTRLAILLTWRFVTTWTYSSWALTSPSGGRARRHLVDAIVVANGLCHKPFRARDITIVATWSPPRASRTEARTPKTCVLFWFCGHFGFQASTRFHMTTFNARLNGPETNKPCLPKLQFMVHVVDRLIADQFASRVAATTWTCQSP